MQEILSKGVTDRLEAFKLADLMVQGEYLNSKATTTDQDWKVRALASINEKLPHRLAACGLTPSRK